MLVVTFGDGGGPFMSSHSTSVIVMGAKFLRTDIIGTCPTRSGQVSREHSHGILDLFDVHLLPCFGCSSSFPQGGVRKLKQKLQC